MMEEHKCSMEAIIKRMQDDILKGENNTKEITEIVSKIKDSHTETKYVMKSIQDTQAAMALADRESKIAMAASGKETKDLLVAGLKAIEDRRLLDEVKTNEEKKLLILSQKEKDRERDTELKDIQKEKRKFRWSVYLAVLLLLINTIYGFLVKYAPSAVGLHIGK